MTQITTQDIVMNISKTIAEQVSWNALSAIECILRRLETPLIHEYKLNDLRYGISRVGTHLINKLLEECADQQKALNRCRDTWQHSENGRVKFSTPKLFHVQNNREIIHFYQIKA